VLTPRIEPALSAALVRLNWIRALPACHPPATMKGPL
jgi:hypothetical protein